MLTRTSGRISIPLRNTDIKGYDIMHTQIYIPSSVHKSTKSNMRVNSEF